MTTPLRVLIVEDTLADAELMVLRLQTEGFQLDWERVQTEPDYLAALATPPDLILADWRLPQFSGLRALHLLRARGLDIPFIIVSGSIGEEPAIDALRQGAYDYVLKDRVARLGQAVQHALEDKRLREQRKRVEEALRQRLMELEAVHTVSTALRIAQTLDEALPIVLDQTLAALQTDAGTIWLYHPASGELRPAVTRGWFSQLDQTPMKPGEGIAGQVFVSGQAHLSTEFVGDPFAYCRATESIPAGWGGACLPIRTCTASLGVLFASVPLPRQITPEQMKLLGSLAEMAGITLHRIRLFEETNRRLEHLNALHAIDTVVRASFDLRITLNALLEHIVTQLKVDAAAVLLLSSPLQTLDCAAARGFRTRNVETIRLRLSEGLAGYAVIERRTVRVWDAAHANAWEKLHFARWAGEGFAAYCGVPLIAKGEVKGVLEIYQRIPVSPDSQWMDFLETFAAQAAIAIENTQLFENLQRSNNELFLAYDDTVRGWSRALDLRDKETEGHTERVTEMTERLAKALGMGGVEIVNLRRGALLHDIGKMGIPDSILLKPSPLTDDEWAIMRQHPQLAYEMLSPIAYLKPALDIPYCHHEKWDGTGYPQQLRGEQIPLVARLFALADVYDALTHDRPYRPAWAMDEALDHICAESGKHFEPRLVQLFLQEIAQE